LYLELHERRALFLRPEDTLEEAVKRGQ